MDIVITYYILHWCIPLLMYIFLFQSRASFHPTSAGRLVVGEPDSRRASTEHLCIHIQHAFGIRHEINEINGKGKWNEIKTQYP